ncbi:MAG TPA: hypothetical protein VFN10_08765 [Thermoanaerobaculia bacterium]|nr:hypothetical protein [Thermoanaerobaculia bacterium]
MRRLTGLVFLLVSFSAYAATFPSGQPSTTNNDDSCDIAVLPAATLLLPYFEVSATAPAQSASTTLFTIVNTVREPQIAHVTIWTDLAWPVLTFNLVLTGYDVQSVNLYDVLVRGVIPQTSNATTRGARSLANGANPHFFPTATDACAELRLGGPVPPLLQQQLLPALTRGSYSGGPAGVVGMSHPDIAVGYATIDVTATCSNLLPSNPQYFQEILYDNVLTGDYQYVNPNAATGNYAGGNPLVHIRALPEGGPAGAGATATNLPFTFYDRLTPAEVRQVDRRQPLPTTFAVRFIEGGPTAFQTKINIWREAVTAPNAGAEASAQNVMRIGEVIRFDERENPTEVTPLTLLDPPPPDGETSPRFPAASSTLTGAGDFPALSGSGDVGGWIYINLNNRGSNAYSVAPDVDLKSNSSTTTGPRQSQNWVAASMYAEGRYSTLTDATMLSNGCTRAPATPYATTPGATVPPIGPGPNTP